MRARLYRKGPDRARDRDGARPVLSRLAPALYCLLLATGACAADTVTGLLDEYAAAGAGPFSAAQGEAFWQREFPGEDGKPRACTSCHTRDLRAPGRHTVTAKAIKPLAPSANPERLTDRGEIEKWLKRNCKWTIGRECTVQEKGDVLSFLSTR